MPVAVVTDSTADLPPELCRERGVTVVPLTVVIDGAAGHEGRDVTPEHVAGALATRRATVSTSRPAPEEFRSEYRRLIADGATGILSVHLSANLSGTYDSAAHAAAELPVPSAVVDSRSTGMGLGFPVLAAAEAAAAGADLPRVEAAAVAAAERTTTLFYVDTLDFLRRGGRIGAASALLGTALSVKPILRMGNGAIVVRDRVRTATRALARLVDLAVESAGDGPVDVAVHHLDAPERAAALVAALTERLGARLRERFVLQIGAAVAAHTGPGLLSIVTHRRP
ncbi:DegV family protein [Rhizomonospora bruguierae]|uniref:DegV family protein n=1 Tax=Rhizomonospora bruguierae TaxID=1581705 RepID=UPI001BCE6DCE|nr:DegV family protein [Micromonospora sp. NBRC 107566]